MRRKSLVVERGMSRMTRMFQTDRKATTIFNGSIQKRVFERATHRTLNQLSYSSRRLLISVKNKKQRLKFNKEKNN